MKNKINFFNSEAIVRLTPIKDNTILVADNILRGQWKIFPTLLDLDIESIDNIWEMKYPSTESTYALYTYALYPLSYLLNAYEVSGNEIYLDHSLIISQSFISWINSSDKKISSKRKNILFGDHAVSNRTQSLCYLLISLNKSGREIPPYLIDQLLAQGKYLSDIDNYSNYNHGLMMDLSLLGLVNVLRGENCSFPDFFQINLLERLNKSLLRDVTEDGVHIENSTGYHFWIMNFYKKMRKPLLELDKSLAEKCEKVLDKSLEYAKYITRSDGSVPALGDTHASLKNTSSHTLSSKFFSESNIVIFRDLDDRVWASFNSGYKTHVHKHADDGSFNLFYKGKDVFFDPGFLNYESNEDSKKIKSASHHNTVKPANEEFDIVQQDLNGKLESKDYKKNISKSRIKGFYCDGDYEASIAVISGYSVGDIERLIIFNKAGYFIIHDRIIDTSENNTRFEQRFNVNNRLIVLENDERFIEITDDKNIKICTIRQFLKTDSIENKEVKVPKIENTFYAKGFDLKEQCKRIVFSFEGRESLLLIDLKDYQSVNKQNSTVFSSESLFSLCSLFRSKMA